MAGVSRAGWLRSSIAVVASGALLVPAAVFAEDEPASGTGTTIQGEVRPRGKAPAVLGFAAVGGKRVTGATVRVYARPAGKSRFSKGLSVRKGKSTPVRSVRTNVAGGFNVLVDELPPTFLISVRGGKIAGKPFKGRLLAIGRASERGVVVNPVTTITAKYAVLHPKVKATTASKHVAKYLGIKGLGNEVFELGMTTWTNSKAFSPLLFAKAARKRGGLDTFTTQLAKKVEKGKHQRFQQKNYRPRVRSTFPLADKYGNDRFHDAAISNASKASGKSRVAGAQVAEGVAEALMDEVAAATIHDSMCAFVGSSIAGNMGCPEEPDFGPLVDALTDIDQQLQELNTEVADIEVTLTEMQEQLNEIESLNEDILQQTLLTQAQQAQQNWTTAYKNAGIAQIEALVDEANSDMQFLYAADPPPNTTTTKLSSTASINQQCAAVYPALQASNGQVPYTLCVDYLTQVDAFAAPSTAYYRTLYNGLTGASSTPQNDLLIYTYQQMLTSAGNSPVPQSTLASMQEQFANLSSLQDAAYAMLAAGQMFSYTTTTGQLTSCPNIPQTGNYPANTTISVSGACNTVLTGLFADSVVDTLAAQVAVPIPNTVADARTNYLWWAYPVDTSLQTANSGSYPYYPGAPSGTYTNLTTSCTIGLVGFTPSGAYWNSCGARILTNHQYNLKVATGTQTTNYMTNMLLLNGQTIANALTSQGFKGIGTTSYGMSWNNLGTDADSLPAPVVSNYMWQQYPTTTNTGCTNFPGRISLTFEWTGYYCTTYGTQPEVGGIFPQHIYDTTQKQIPPSPTACPALGQRYTSGNWTSSGTGLCWGPNTFALLVDTTAPAPGAAPNGVLPPFWSPRMLVGAPSAGVPVIPIPAPTPVS